MNTLKNKPPIIVYPDPVVDIEMLSGAIFLYFDEPIALTLPPVILSKDSYNLLDLIKERMPKWKETFYNLFNTWRIQHDCCNKVFEILSPLKGEHLINMWTIYPANSTALIESEELVASSGLSFDSVKNMINPLNAPGELIRHIMLET